MELSSMGILRGFRQTVVALPQRSVTLQLLLPMLIVPAQSRLTEVTNGRKVILAATRQQQTQTGATQQQVIQVQDHFRVAGKGQFRPQGVSGANAVMAQLGDQLRQPRQVTAMPSGQAPPLTATEPRNRQRWHDGKHRRAVITEG